MNHVKSTRRGAVERDVKRQRSPATWVIALVAFTIVLGLLGWGLVGNSDKGLTSRPNTTTGATEGTTASSATQAAPSGSSGTVGQPTQNPGPAQTNR